MGRCIINPFPNRKVRKLVESCASRRASANLFPLRQSWRLEGEQTFVNHNASVSEQIANAMGLVRTMSNISQCQAGSSNATVTQLVKAATGLAFDFRDQS